jgi:hypothetical protein
MAARLLGAGAWLTIVVAALDLTIREVARRPLLPQALGGTWSPATIAALAAGAAVLAFTLAPRPRRGLFHGTPLLFAVLFCTGVAAQIALGARLQSDGFYYFAYLRSIAFDRDVEFSNDYRLLGLGDKTHLFQPTPTGYAQSAWTVGPAILWSPFFAAGHLVARELHDGNPDVSVNGISFPYRQAVCIGGLVYGLLGCWLTFRLARRFSTSPLAAGATAVTIAGSFMLWYIVKEPSMTHAPSMALVAGFAWAWAATRAGRTKTQWALLGLLAGLMTLVRWQNAIFAILPACDSAILLYQAWRSRDRQAATAAIATGLLFTAAATLAFVPQMLAWKSIYGSWLAVSPVGPQIRLMDPHLVDILWSARNGLFSTAPALYAGVIGLLLFARSSPSIGIPALLAIVLMTWFNASIQDWWGSAGFGGRRFDGIIPLLAIGTAYLLASSIAVVTRFPGAVVSAAAAAIVVWNLTLMSAAQAGILGLGEAVSFGDTMAAQARAFHGWFGNPFTYPVSLLYALRNGVTPGRYDLLSANRFLGDPLQPYGRIDVGGGDEWLLEDGWHQPEREGATSFRWTTATAVTLLPLDRAEPLRVQVRLHAFGFPGAAPQSLTLDVNGRPRGTVTVEPGWHTVDIDVPKADWRAGVNRVALRFAWEQQPARVGLGGDERRLAAAVDSIRVAVLETDPAR